MLSSATGEVGAMVAQLARCCSTFNALDGCARGWAPSAYMFQGLGWLRGRKREGARRAMSDTSRGAIKHFANERGIGREGSRLRSKYVCTYVFSQGLRRAGARR